MNHETKNRRMHLDSYGLYVNEPNILSLDDDTFFDNVLNDEHLIIINYYKHWSPACQRFSNIFKNFSRDIRSWNRLVKLIAVDCAENLICYQTLRTNDESDDGDGGEAINFPIIQFIPPRSKDINEDVKQIEIDAIDELYTMVINEIVSNSFLANRFHLIPIMAKSITEICYMLKEDNNHQFVNKEHYAIIEPTSTSPLQFGAMVILDLLNYRDFVTIKRFVGDHYLVNNLFPHHIDLPVILEVSPSSCQYRVIGNIKNLRLLKHEFVNSIKNRFMMQVESDGEQNNQKPFKMINVDSNKVIKYNLSYVDLHNALRYSLVHELSSRKFFNAKQVDVIKQIYSIILNFFPFDNENVRRFFKRMIGWLENKQSDLAIEKYLAAIKTSDGFLKPMESWRHCNGSRPIYRGYPCGFWVLFHAMVVNEYNITKMDPHVKPKVLPVMRSYIATFFTCRQCRQYFLNVSDNLEYELIYPNSSVLWLWKIHNQLNSRLEMQSNDDNDDGGDWQTVNDPYYPKYQFPTKEMCHKCIMNNGQYDEREVLNFLCNYYSKTSIRNNRAWFISPLSSITCLSLLIMLLNYHQHQTVLFL